MSVLAVVVDPDGRRVELTSERWAHVLDIHPELKRWQHAVLRAISEPTVRRDGRRPNEEWFYLDGVGPSQWLKVVVAFRDNRGWVVTAFPRRSFP